MRTCQSVYAEERELGVIRSMTWQAMATHARLGAASKLRLIPEVLIKPIVEASSSPFVLTLYPEIEPPA